ncbi:unnamed protein product [Arctia plantaginis]|uniref:Uncharacterized protein n=1 Tax=Arctia plantaginis TaxID=874455 RepID=A0A8S0ZCW0_ARCPL|nr:unnamed protein product [Arctia plantaginis]
MFGERVAKRARKMVNFLKLLMVYGKPVSPAKLADIQSILHLIPQDAQSFYNGLISDDAIEDDINGLDTVDFEMQFDENIE